MKQKRTGYSIDEANELIKKQIQKSAERLKKELKKARKNNRPSNFKLRKIQ